MKKNNQMVLWAVIALVVLGGIWYYSSSSSWGGAGVATTTPSGTESGATGNTGGTSSGTTGGTSAGATSGGSTNTTSGGVHITKTAAKTVGLGTLPFLLGLKDAMVCTVSSTQNYLRNGTLYISADGKARADFSTASMIDDGTNLYVWNTGATTGTKAQASSGVGWYTIANRGGIDLTTNMSFACNPWTVDASKFAPPASVTFGN